MRPLEVSVPAEDIAICWVLGGGEVPVRERLERVRDEEGGGEALRFSDIVRGGVG